MKTNLIVHDNAQQFNKILNEHISKAEKENYVIRDIKFSDDGKRFSAILLLVKLSK